jgi:hypothetical protein
VVAHEMLAMRSYLKDLIGNTTDWWVREAGGVTNYALFIQLLDRWRAKNRQRVALVTFNYDELLERAITFASAQGGGFNSRDSYISRSDYLLFKPHGSLSWNRTFKTSDTSWGQLRASAATLDPYAVHTIDERQFGELLTLPAIAVPTISKIGFEWPSGHEDVLMAVLPNVDRIITGGWRGQEEHFTRLLKDLLPAEAEGTAVNSDEASSALIADSLRTRLERSWSSHPAEGFSQLVVDAESLDRLLP